MEINPERDIAPQILYCNLHLLLLLLPQQLLLARHSQLLLASHSSYNINSKLYNAIKL